MIDTISEKLTSYPVSITEKLSQLRDLIEQIAQENQCGPVEESLKWGQLSYGVKTGTSIRLDWQSDHEDRLYLYVHCQTKLVATYRELYPEAFVYEGNRAVVIPIDYDFKRPELAHCIQLALTYKHRKHLPMLGA